MGTRLLILGVLVFLSLATMGSSAAVQQRSATPAPLTEHANLKTLPASVLDADLKDSDGRSFTLSNYSGKVLVVNLWATWCGPCRLQLLSLAKLQKQFQSQGMEIVGLSTENPDASVEGVREVTRNYGVYYRIGWATPELALTLMQGRDAIPQTFVVSGSGRIVRRFVGFNRTATPSQLKLAIKQALNEKSDLPGQN